MEIEAKEKEVKKKMMEKIVEKHDFKLKATHV